MNLKKLEGVSAEDHRERVLKFLRAFADEVEDGALDGVPSSFVAIVVNRKGEAFIGRWTGAQLPLVGAMRSVSRSILEDFEAGD